MDPNLQRIVSWWIIVFYYFTNPAQSRLDRGPNFHHINSPVSVRTFQQTQPRMQIKQQNLEHSELPPLVMVRCHPDSMEVVVQADLFYTSQKVDGGHLRLGLDSQNKVACKTVSSGEEEFTLLIRLTECGTKLSSTEDKIIYSNNLVYSPEPTSDGLLRMDEANIPVECHYEKRYTVDGPLLQPTWVPSISEISSENQIDFALRIMTNDWQFERESYTFFLGDSIYFEASVVMGNHLPLKVYVDHCVATATPDAEATLRHDFIDRRGCLVDAYLTHSDSHFLPRVDEHKLRFELEAFLFYQEPSNQIYVTCHLKAVPVTVAVSSENRACSLIGNRWRSVDGNDHACESCGPSQQVETTSNTEPAKAIKSSQGKHSVVSKEDVIWNKVDPASNAHFPLKWHKTKHTTPQQSLTKFIKRDADYKEQQTIQLGPLRILPSSQANNYKKLPLVK